MKLHIRQLGIAILLFTVVVSCKSFKKASHTAPASSDPWNTAKEILKEIKAPSFPKKEFYITSYGAIANGKFNCSEAFRKAIEECNKQGGGKVVVPEGDFYTGPIYLKSNVNLNVKKGARILFSTRPEDYPIVFTRWEGVELMNYSSLIYSFGEKNIAITGEGTLDGQANETNWWPWKGQAQYGWKKGMPSQVDKDKRAALFKMAEDGVPVSERRF